MFCVMVYLCRGEFMELLQLKYFVTVAKMQSMTQAANYHHIPQSAMSQTISRLEKELGNIKLFDRNHNRIYLNEKGKVFLEYAEKTLNSLENGIASVSAADTDAEKEIKILVQTNSRLIVHCVSCFASKYPNVTFHICHDYIGQDETDYDICVSSGNYYNNMSVYSELIKENLMIAVCSDNVLYNKNYVSLDELRGQRFVVASKDSPRTKVLQAACHNYGFEPNVAIYCNDPYYIRKYISENMGISLVPSVSWSGRFRDNTKLIPVKGYEMTATSYLLINKNRLLHPVLKDFCDFITSKAHSIPENLLCK